MRNKTTDLRRPLPQFLGALFLLAFSSMAAAQDGDWLQWGRTPQHGGASPVVAQPLQSILARVVYDPFVEAMKAETGGFLLAHYAVPLSDGSGIYMVFKTGVYLGFGNWEGLTWTVKKLRWNGASLETVWTFVSDWKPEPIALAVWEPVFLPAISGNNVYVPGLGGTVHRVDRNTGVSSGRVNPFGTLDLDRYVAGGLGVAGDGSVVYNVVDLSLADPRGPVRGAWLVKVAPDGTAARAAFSALVPGAPTADALCVTQFANSERPWPPSTTATPTSAACGAQRPGLNVVPAVAPDGTIYTLSRAHSNDRYSYLVAAHPDLTPAWTASLRDLLDDGCGVLLPSDSSPGGCRTGANLGVDPATNDLPAGRVRDQGTSSPVVLPDGSVLLGASTSYNFSRGHLLKFDAQGQFLASFDFGWDITPAVYPHDGTYSILIKDNYYGTPDGSAFYEVSSLDADLEEEWSFLATNTESCVRQPDDSIDCIDDHPEGFEWCVNQPAVDAAGTLHLNSEDGALFAFDREGNVVGHLFLDTALGAAYTPIAIGRDGLIYAQNNGVLFIVGIARVPRETPEPPAPGSRTSRVVERP